MHIGHGESPSLPLARARRFSSVQGGGDATPRVSKLNVLELSEKSSGLPSTSTRDWWCFFYPRSIFHPVMRGQR